MENLLQLSSKLDLTNVYTQVVSVGTNMKCDKVLTKSILYKEDGRWCLRNKGVDMYCDDLSKLYLNTKENRKELRSIIKNS